MGCKISKEEEEDNETTNERSITTVATTNTMTSKIPAVDYKSRLEWKICLAKDTPEPEFDLSDCMLKEIPPGVFVLCRVLLKERLQLQKNQLRMLSGGGSLNDLSRLQVLNLSFNRFTRLPDDFCYTLKNLRELILSNNQFENVPNAINQLNNLELLDVSYNQLAHISPINCMPKLRILNICGNKKLTRLPSTLSTCDSLNDIVFDAEDLVYPPANVLECGTREILNYLLTQNSNDAIEPKNHPVSLNNSDRMKKVTSDFMDFERGIDVAREMDTARNKYTRGMKFIDHERSELEKYSNLEAELHQQQLKRKQDLLQHLLQQQNESDNLIQKVQKEKDSERHKLIEDILKAELNAGMIVEKLISLKQGPDPALIEQEHEEQKQLLEKLRINHDGLRKSDILAAMTELLDHETKQIELYNEQRDTTSRTLLEYEHNSNTILDNIYKSNDRDRMAIVSKITQNEELQKAAFATFVERNDARTWGLIEQVRIVESQLAAMTNCEIDRKKLELDDQMVDLSEQRMNLTFILLDLLDQRAKRKKELLDTLVCLELQKENEQQDFWLLQYQKLLDSQPCELSFKSSSIDPMLGYNFLVNGVVHCIPFLSKLWQSTSKANVLDISDTDLIEAGIKKAQDREKILKSIKDFVEQYADGTSPPTAPKAEKQVSIDEATTSNEQELSTNDDEPSTDLGSECVICMENTCKVIFLPCGHLCCCLNCQNTIDICPMCRAAIERRIKVIQS